ncbi:methyltransferase family protein [Kitasatospora sp. NPDC092948]|uniref:methyltransferase family protein n=1 Tax=Kitasatospora sp. NPDC092948 TaxID=3364088 RepID=UPI003826C75D
MNQRAVVLCLRALLPVASAAIVVAIVLLLTADGPAPHLVAALFASAYLLWILAEARISVRHPSQSAAENSTLLPYALSRAGTAMAAVLWPLPWDRWSPWLIAPIAVSAGAVALRLVAIRTLGRFYSHHVVRYSDHSIVSTGPYRFARHPAYTGMLLANAGFVAFFLNPLSVLMFVALCTCVIWRILVEERVLWVVPGYPDYASGRARLIPGVW